MGDEFGADADGDFGDGLGADVDAEGGVDGGECFAGDAFGGEVLQDHLDFAFAADETNVACAAVGQMEESFLVVVVSAGDDEAVGVWRDFQVGQDLFDGAADSALGAGEPLFAEVLGAIIDDPDVEVQIGGQISDGLAYVAGTDDDQSAAWQHGEIGYAAGGIGSWAIQ